MKSPGTWRRLVAGDADLSRKQRHTVIAWLALSPVLLWLLVFKYIALGWNIVLTFFDRSYTGEMSFMGLENWTTLLQDPVFPTALRNTLILFGTIPVGIVLALFIAILLNQTFPGSKVFRSVFFLPYITMMVAIAVIWAYMFKSQGGVVNYALQQMGIIEQNIPWLSNSWWARLSVIIVHVWKTTGFYLIIILAGLQNIPQELYEVARIDGASTRQRFLYVTLPLLKPTLGVCALVGLVTSFELFDLVQVLTSGGPARSTEILITWIYKQAFEFGNYGYSAVLAIILFLIMAGGSLLGMYIQSSESA